ncbi:MAG: hypothetical protein R2710_12645 [Acidimicrobiales bacterium]
MTGSSSTTDVAPHVEGWWVGEVATTHDMLVADQEPNTASPGLVA